MAQRALAVELADPLGVLLAIAAGVAAWLLHVPAPVALFAAVAVLGVKVGAGLALHGREVDRPAATPLTRKESEIAVLVEEGLTNREIAQRLFIAERTVDNHVQHILQKLGFHSRAQIAAWNAQRRARAREK